MKERSLFVLGWFVALVGLSPAALASADSLWLYRAKGSFLDLAHDGKLLNISGSMVIETPRDWSSFLPAQPPSVTGLNLQHFFSISSFDLDIGHLDFFGGGPPSHENAIQFNTLGFLPFGYSQPDTFLTGSGDFTSWYIFSGLLFFASDGTQLNVEQLYDAPPPIIHWGPAVFDPDRFGGGPASSAYQFDLTLERVAPIPEPEVYAMLGVGLALLGWARRNRKAGNGGKQRHAPGAASA